MAPMTRGMRASANRLPLDVLLKVLLLLPAKDLCRLRSVCRSWRTAISDEVFIAAHAARHRQTLFLAKFWADLAHVVYVVDLAGNVLKRIVIAGTGGSLHRLMRTSSELACFASYAQLDNRCLVLNPATGAVHVLPEKPAVKYRNGVKCCYFGTFFALGRVSSTGEHKVLRILDRASFTQSVTRGQFFEVFTINGSGTNHGQWRVQEKPIHFVEEPSGTVVDGGLVYFLTSRLYDDVSNNMIPADYILSFDLGREQWRRDLQGPISSSIGTMEASPVKRHQIALAELKGSLVVADHHQHPFIMDLWFLVDFENGHWVKEYRIQTESVIYNPNGYHLKPLLVLDDGRLVVCVGPTAQPIICDPGTNTFEVLNIRRPESIAVYTGNLLSLEQAGMGARSSIVQGNEKEDTTV